MTAQDIIDAFGGTKPLASTMGIPSATVLYWGRRGRIPVRYWDELIALAKTKNVRRINVETLRATHRERAA